MLVTSHFNAHGTLKILILPKLSVCTRTPIKPHYKLCTTYPDVAVVPTPQDKPYTSVTEYGVHLPHTRTQITRKQL